MGRTYHGEFSVAITLSATVVPSAVAQQHSVIHSLSARSAFSQSARPHSHPVSGMLSEWGAQISHSPATSTFPLPSMRRA